MKNFRPDEGPLKDDVLCVQCQTSRPEVPELCGDRRGCECDEDGVGLDVEVDKTRRVEVPDPFTVARRTPVRTVVVRVLPAKVSQNGYDVNTLFLRFLDFRKGKMVVGPER